MKTANQKNKYQDNKSKYQIPFKLSCILYGVQFISPYIYFLITISLGNLSFNPFSQSS
jgi:hypothetical protein